MWSEAVFAGRKLLEIPPSKEFIAGVKKRSAIVIDPDIMSGTPVFAGTRAPVRSLLDHIEAGDGLDIFLADFPLISRSQTVPFLKESKRKAAK
jgi:uncharacterized protein (DUF433 family)